jgi:hypothetical protein
MNQPSQSGTPSNQSPSQPSGPSGQSAGLPIPIPFQIPPYPPGLSLSLAQARVDLPREEFRYRLRKRLLDHPGLTLAQVARELQVSRQRIGSLVGRLNRPDCTQVPRPAPRKDEAARLLPELTARVRAGESAEKAARELGVSLAQTMRLGFRVRDRAVRPPHGTQARFAAGCPCYRCRRVGGLALPRGPRTGPGRRAAILDWLAWRDPDTGLELRQTQIARLAGVHQPLVSRLARAMGGAE